MSTELVSPNPPPAQPAAGIVDRILVGVDGTRAGFAACRQALQLAEPESRLEAATVQLAPGLTEKSERLTAATLQAASRILGARAETRCLHGLVVEQLLEESRRAGATLLALGSHGHPRLEEIVLGGVAGELLHQAPCSVLIARPVPDVVNFPRRIVVGLDGSEESELALEVARRLARRRHGSLRAVVASGGKRVDVASIVRRHPRLVDASPAPAVRALVDASREADLLAVGSRGLHGPRALGSVSERVAHKASCSVLVVRPPA